MKKLQVVLIAVGMMLILAGCAGSRGYNAKGCGCAAKKGMVGY